MTPTEQLLSFALWFFVGMIITLLNRHGREMRYLEERMSALETRVLKEHER